MANFISYEDIELLADALLQNDKTRINFLKQHKDLVSKAKEIDYSINPPAHTIAKFNVHTPSRLFMFLLSYYGEHAIDKARISINKDDPNRGIKSMYHHTNTYDLTLNNLESHEKLSAGNAPYEANQHDFNTVLLEQKTFYKGDNMSPTDTTEKAYDSFKRYTTAYDGRPSRRIEFKSAYWNFENAKNLHSAHYVIVITKAGTIRLFYNPDYSTNVSQNFSKLIELQPQQDFNICLHSENEAWLSKYINLCSNFDNLKKFTWSALLEEAND